MRRIKNNGGFGILLSICVICLCMMSLSLLLLHNSYQSEHSVRQISLINEEASKDTALQRDTANDLMSQIVVAVKSGATTASMSAANNSYSTTLNATPGSTVTRLDVSDSAVITSKSVTGDTIASGLTVAAWSPAAPQYSAITLPSSIYSLRNGTIVGKSFNLSFTRTLAASDNLKTTQQTSSDSLSKTIQIIEFPSQTAVSGKSVRVTPQATVVGSVVAQRVTLDAATHIGTSVTVSRNLVAAANTQVGTTTISAAISSAATASLSKQLEAGAFSAGTPVNQGTISVIRGNESAAMVELGDRTPDAEGVPAVLLQAATPNNWDEYCLPFYACSTRITATLNALGTIALISIKTYDTATYSGRVTVTTTIVPFNVTAGGAAVKGISLANKGTAKVLLVDPVTLAVSVTVASARAVYVDFLNSAGKRLDATSNLFVGLTASSNLSTLAGFSLVTPNRCVCSGKINTITPVPFSILATEMRYGFIGFPPVLHTGQAGNLGTATTTDNDITALRGLAGTAIYDSGKQLTLNDITVSTQIPPVTLKNWLVLTP